MVKTARHRQSKQTNPLVSVIIPTYYRNELLEKAIESVLRQDYDPLELIVVDDSGEGHATPVLKQYNDVVIDIIRETNGGDMIARQTGFEASMGRYIHFLDDDDIFLDGKISKTAEILINNPNVGVAFTGVKYDQGWRSAPSSELSENMLNCALRFESGPCYTGSMLIRRHHLADIFPQPQFSAGNDSNLMIELGQRTKFDYVDEYLVYTRRNESEIWTGLNKIKGMKEVVEFQEEIYDRYPGVKRDVLTKINFEEGIVRLDNQTWSPRATLCFARAAYYATDEWLKYGGAVIASLFGQPGFKVGGTFRQMLS